LGPFFPFSEPFLLVPAYTVVFLGMSDVDAAAPWLAEGEEDKGVLGDLLQRYLAAWGGWHLCFGAPFVWLKSQAEKYCSLIYCERKTLYHGEIERFHSIFLIWRE
jgi:hypothetical protein